MQRRSEVIRRYAKFADEACCIRLGWGVTGPPRQGASRSRILIVLALGLRFGEGLRLCL